MSTTKIRGAENIETLSKEDVKAVETIKNLDNVNLVIIYDIEHDGKRYVRGERVTLPRISAEYHINNGNCEIVK